ncbi:hypothetical protein [Streptomyces chiangmaiensis]|uniref:Uncharacterized protein n=1 Tax=Streptomyces chiangmaiensis TaxID=766497 RepID=A0ABU7FTI9_9ACTN|nr:hypothetical protein [Streptomyces chiangmaiensis]MED7826404.1 hypothetical protein [Streptomyces chiangmaiensis]
MGRAEAQGLQLTGAGGLLRQPVKWLLEFVLEGDVTHRLGDDTHDPVGKNSGNARSGK